MKELEPGTEQAIAEGCTCMMRDGEGINNPDWPDWLTEGCPLHDPNLRGTNEGFSGTAVYDR